jgi:HAD domain in Swiss Army Knife RNA repair proteins
MKLIFLDIDGVLNGHERYPNGYCGTKWECVQRLNWVLFQTGAKLVISSAWRYLVLSEYMNLKGFENLLLTHGVDSLGRVLDVLDADASDKDRGQLILQWLDQWNWKGAYVVLDDMNNLGIAEAGHPHVLVDGALGLTDEDAHRAVAILIGKEGKGIDLFPSGREEALP